MATKRKMPFRNDDVCLVRHVMKVSNLPRVGDPPIKDVVDVLGGAWSTTASRIDSTINFLRM
eukprot:7008892-Prorocentrum_lima.AAC.1